jgi:hypothetical protein
MAEGARVRAGLIHFAVTGALTAAVLYALCWGGAALGWSAASHLYLSLFTTEPAASSAALVQGVCLSIGFGALAGALTAVFANLFGFLAPR